MNGNWDDRPPRLVGPLESMLRYPLLTFLPLVALLAAGAYIGLARKQEYTAQARLNVGRVNVPAYSLQNVIQGNATLAVSYARAIEAPAVLAPAARHVKISLGTARDRLVATPVPGSTIIRIDATGPSAAKATALANAASDSLRAYVVRLNQNSGTNAVLRRYTASQVAVQRAQSRFDRARASGNGALEAKVALRSAQLRSSSIEDQYRTVINEQAPRNLVQVLAPATTADSDRNSRLQKLLLIGGVAGLALGLVLAMLVANREAISHSRNRPR